MTLEQFVDRVDSGHRSLIVAHESEGETYRSMLSSVVDEGVVSVRADDVERLDDGTVALLDDTGRVLATSPLDELQRTVLFVNSDLYTTGTTSFERFKLPSVIERLDDVPFELRGYPVHPKEKLLLIVISRYVEQRAWEAGEGTLRTSFQKLSRIDDERGTRTVYERLTETDLDVHLYGQADWRPSRVMDVTMHAGRSADFRDSWFVVYRPSDGGAGSVALLAIENDDDHWSGFWTFDPDRVRGINRYIERRM
jgi:hypothetical protein